MIDSRTTSHRANNIDFLRWFLATMVVLNHSYSLTGNVASEPLLVLTDRQVTLGRAGVDLFFVLSGWLVYDSWNRSRSVRDYLAKRVLRIYPAFIVATLIAFFIGLAGAPKVNLSLLNLLVLRIESTSANAPMWTLAYEFGCYLLLLVGGLLFRRKPHVIWLAIVPAALVAYVFTFDAELISLWDVPIQLPRLAAVFGIGVLLNHYQALWRGKRWVIPVAGLLAVLFALAGAWYLIFPVAAPMAIAVFAFWKNPLNGWAKIGDLSYGTYIFHWPVMQALRLYQHKWDLWIFFPTALAITYVLAFLSWHLVEKQCLKLKPRPRAPIEASAAL